MNDMNDEKVRELLGRYRPVRPPSGLRERVLADAATTARTWTWAVAAAVLLATVVGLHVATDRAIASIAMPIGPPSVEALAEAMGGGEEAQRAAQSIVGEQAFHAWLTGTEADGQLLEEQLKGTN